LVAAILYGGNPKTKEKLLNIIQIKNMYEQRDVYAPFMLLYPWKCIKWNACLIIF